MSELQDSAARPLKFQEIADNLRRAILAGTWVVGQRLPTEQQLVTSSGYSLNTVRRALDLLVEEGLAERRQGAGTFVLPRSSPRTARQTVGVLLPDTSLYYPRVLHGIESTLSAQRASLQLSSYGYDPDKEDGCIEHLLSAGADGLLLVPTLAGIGDPQTRVEELLRLPVPVVLVERHLAELGVADRSEHVCSDHAAGAYDALVHLHGLGHSRIALLLRGRSPTGVGVAAGYQRAVTDVDLAGELVLRADVAEWEAGHAETVIEHIRSWGGDGGAGLRRPRSHVRPAGRPPAWPARTGGPGTGLLRRRTRRCGRCAIDRGFTAKAPDRPDGRGATAPAPARRCRVPPASDSDPPPVGGPRFLRSGHSASARYAAALVHLH